MRERKKTAVHGTLEMIPVAWKFNSKKLLCKTLNSRMNIIETRAVLKIVKTDGKWAPEEKYSSSGGPVLFLTNQFTQCLRQKQIQDLNISHVCIFL